MWSLPLRAQTRPASQSPDTGARQAHLIRASGRRHWPFGPPSVQLLRRHLQWSPRRRGYLEASGSSWDASVWLKGWRGIQSSTYISPGSQGTLAKSQGWCPWGHEGQATFVLHFSSPAFWVLVRRVLSGSSYGKMWGSIWEPWETLLSLWTLTFCPGESLGLGWCVNQGSPEK